MKIVKKILSSLIIIILLIIVLISGIVFINSKKNPNEIPSIFGYEPFVVLSGSMETEIYKGDLVIVKKVEAKDLKENDIIAFRDDDNYVVTHRIVEKIEDRIVNTAEESKTISLNLKYKAVNTIETPSVYVVVKKKSNDTNYNTIINNWTYTLADQIKDTTNSTDKIESTTMTLNIPQGSENGFYRVFITIGDKTTSLNIVIYDGEMSEVIVGQNDT